MWREVARRKQALEREECIEILKREKRGVLSVLGDDDYPYGSPINHLWRDADGCLYFHGGKFGHKIDAMRAHDKASFCVMDEGGYMEDDPLSWALHFKSVIVFGRIEFVESMEETLEISRELCYKFTDDEAYIADEIEHSGPKTLCFRLRPEHITGKRVKES